MIRYVKMKELSSENLDLKIFIILKEVGVIN